MAFGTILYNTDLWLETESLPYLHEYYKAKLANLPYILRAAEHSSSAHRTPIRSNKHLPSPLPPHARTRDSQAGYNQQALVCHLGQSSSILSPFFCLKLYTPLPLNWGISEKQGGNFTERAGMCEGMSNWADRVHSHPLREEWVYTKTQVS